MTFARIINLGLGSNIALLLGFALVVGIQTQSLTNDIDAISIRHNAASRSNTRMERLLNTMRLEFSLYEQSERISPDDLTQLLDALKLRSTQLSLADVRVREPVAIILRSVRLAREIWIKNATGKISLDQATAFRVKALSSIRKELSVVRKVLTGIAPQFSSDLVLKKLKRVTRILSLCEIELLRFDEVGGTQLIDVIKSVKQLQDLLTDTTGYDKTTTFTTAHEHAVAATARFKQAVLAMIDDGHIGSTSTYQELSSAADKSHQEMQESVQVLRKEVGRKLDTNRERTIAKLDSTRRLTFGLLAGCVLLSFALAVLLHRRLYSRINSLTLGVEEFSKGHLSARIPILGNDELATVASAFNDMAAMLDAREKERKQHLQAMAEARHAAENANQAKSQFLAAMSHEIRTPMNGVLGMADLLLTGMLDERQRGFVKTIRRSGDALLAIINDILDFSKIEAGRLDLDPQPFELRPLVEEVGQLLAPGAHKKGVEINIVVGHALADTRIADIARLRQILINLAGNAIKFTAQGEITIQVRGDGECPDSDNVHFEVTDTGIGIPVEAHRRIFQPFTQIRSESQRYGGTGLGLSITHDLVTAMGGRLGMKSEPGVGSTFWFDLPLARHEEATPKQALLPGVDFNGQHVLVLSASTAIRKGLAQQLTRMGIAHTALASGREALALAARQEHPGTTLILLDGHLSDMGGIEFAHILHATPAANRTHSIALSMVGDESALTPAWESAHIHWHLTKPVCQSELYDCISGISFGHKAAPCVTAEPPRGQAAAAQFSARILLAEDHPVNQLVATEMLASLGCQTVLAEHGVRVLELLDSEKFDLVLMDCDMPLMDGFEATTKIRRRERALDCAPIRIIAITANALQGDKERCIAAGMDDYLSKPFTRAQLSDVIERSIQCKEKSVITDSDKLETPPAGRALAVADQDALPILDCALVASLNSAGDNFLSELMAKFEENWALDLDRLRRAVDAGDPEAARKAAHRMKSSSANVGAKRLSQCCSDAELAARNADIAAITSTLGHLETEHDRALDALTSKRAQAA